MEQARAAKLRENFVYDPALAKLEASVPEPSLSNIDDEKYDDEDINFLRPVLKPTIESLDQNIMEASEPDS